MKYMEFPLFVTTLTAITDTFHDKIGCPKCRNRELSFTHFNGEPRMIESNDNYEAGWYGRGDLLVIPLWGECGHEWEMCLGFHKGDMRVFTRNIKEREEKEK